MKTLGVGLAVLLLASSVSAGEPVVLRISTMIPEGSPWARELRAFTNEVEAVTNHAVRFRVYYSGIVGDEAEALRRVDKGQLDGIASGGMACERMMPSMKVTRILGVFQSRGEASYIANVLFPTFAEEARRSGYALAAMSGLGSDVILARSPVHNMSDLRKLRLWRWDLDDTGIAMSRQMGLQIVPAPVEEAGRTFDAGRVDGFIGLPSAALVYQWSTRVHYVTDLHIGYLYTCLIITNRSMDRLSVEQQNAIRSGGAKLALRIEEAAKQLDDALLGKLLSRQGLTLVPTSDDFRAEFFRAAGEARSAIADKLVPRALIDRVLSALADYRAEHQERR